ncbi:hypothetical protein NDU88_003623 [Pleurodeles waltl]|uniref:Uncharacterized protein n=1 Tax=Pleurodeles waltl TaxID=8319 RepID=A0AAV7UD34_PLEWA|nr:hypothetical protein NDU88_003623 [Pleurodeles waltl]
MDESRKVRKDDKGVVKNGKIIKIERVTEGDVKILGECEKYANDGKDNGEIIMFSYLYQIGGVVAGRVDMRFFVGSTVEFLMADTMVQEAFRLLREAGRLDLVKSGVGGPSRPTPRASSGVAAAVLACSESRGAASRTMVSGRGGGRARARGEGRRNASRVSGARRMAVGDSPAGKGAAGRTRPSGEGAPEAAVEKPRGWVLSRRGRPL